MPSKPLISISIRLRGDRLDPDQITQVLGVSPTRSQKKGGLKHGSTKFTAKIGVWALKLKSRSASVPELLDELFKKIDNSAVRLDQIAGVEDARADIFVPLSQDGMIRASLEFNLNKSQIEELRQRGLSLYITVT